MNALAISDLTRMAGDARLHDLEVGKRLGFGQPLDIRKLIKRNEAELSRYGVLATVAKTSGKAGGRPTTEYLLNEGQAILICVKSDTDKAADVREQIIKVFLAYRRGELKAQVQTPSGTDTTISTLKRLDSRLGAMEALGQRLERLAEENRKAAMALTHALALWFDQRRAARPRFWWDIEVRGLVLASYRQMTVDQACALIARRCGEDRTPSRSALGRFWQRLDQLKRDNTSVVMH